VAHDAEAFSVQPGQGFRFVHNGMGGGERCLDPATCHSTYVDGKGKRWGAEARDEHTEEARTGLEKLPETTDKVKRRKAVFRSVEFGGVSDLPAT
jgi:hypothetical protein